MMDRSILGEFENSPRKFTGMNVAHLPGLCTLEAAYFFFNNRTPVFLTGRPDDTSIPGSEG